MRNRSLTISKLQSFFLFGARGTGKSTLLAEMFPEQRYFWVDLLDPRLELRYLRDPNRILNDWSRAPIDQRRNNWIVIDEIQKVPKLLDLAHLAIEKHGIKFAMTGSSARKLRYGGSNLLAGRAFTYHLYPFSFMEMGNDFDLNDALHFGLLPRSVALRDYPMEQREFLYSYVNTYLRSEIQTEGLVRSLEPFTRFLQVAAQANGTILNIAKLARQSRVERRTAERYFSLLNDTLVGFFLPSFHYSERKKQASNAKFYFFDTGIVRVASEDLDSSVDNYRFGHLFEHFVILEAIKASTAHRQHFSFSYLEAERSLNSEIDLLASKGQTKILAIEIKSTTDPDIVDIRKLARTSKKIANCTPYIFCHTTIPSLVEGVHIMPWQQGINELFGSSA